MSYKERLNDRTIDKKRILSEFQKLISFDAESFHEREIAEYLKLKLRELGLQVYEDSAYEKILEEDSSRINAASNIYGYLKGNINEAVLFSAHMDTVSPGINKKAIIHEDGTITSDGNTVLGADDVSGIVAILEALTIIKEQKLEHPDIEVLFTVAEEPYCEGSKYIEYDKLKAKIGYVLDLTGPIGTVATSAPSILGIKIHVYGKAAHAGFEPEKGINALSIATSALYKIKTGHVDSITTVNFGKISGGQGKNIVPEEIIIEGEIRSLDHQKSINETNNIVEIFEQETHKAGGKVEFDITENIKAYEIDEGELVVRRLTKAVLEDDRCRMPDCIKTFGGSDANRLNQNGISTIVVACGMENCHSKTEYTNIAELEKSAGIILRLMTMEE